jgi:MarR family transcriptional regulator, lower aerobic nicotinate degradation pathway regulator
LERMLAFAGHQVRRCHQIAVALFAEEVGRFDITPVQYAALTAIAEQPQADATRIAGVIGLDRSTIGNVLERLEGRRLIEREYLARDKRTKRLRLTAEGRRLLEEIAPSIARSQARFVEVLSDDEQHQLRRLLGKLIRLHAADEERLEA